MLVLNSVCSVGFFLLQQQHELRMRHQPQLPYPHCQFKSDSSCYLYVPFCKCIDYASEFSSAWALDTATQWTKVSRLTRNYTCAEHTRINSDMYNSKPCFKSFLFCGKAALHTIKNKTCILTSKVQQPKFVRVILSNGRIAIFRPLLNTPDYSTIIPNPVQAPPSPLFILPFAL